jgi:S1-C subfamily serine protease
MRTVNTLFWQYRSLCTGAASLLLIHYATPPAQAQSDTSAASIVAHYSASTVFIFVRGTSVQGLAETKMGSGFVISREGYVVTAAHLFEDSRHVPYMTYKATGSLGTSFDPSFPTGLIWPLDGIRMNFDVDVALLKLPTNPSQSPYSPVNVCPNAGISPGTRVYSLGFPLGQPLSINSGTLASKDGPHGLWKMDTLVNDGSSGGPVFDDKARVIGVVKGGIEGAPGNNFFVPTSLVPEILAAGQALIENCNDGKVAQAQNANSAPLPSGPEFDNLLKTCALGANIEIKADLIGSIKTIYEGARTSGSASMLSSAEFLKQIPEKERLEAYRLYTECIFKIISRR